MLFFQQVQKWSSFKTTKFFSVAYGFEFELQTENAFIRWSEIERRK